MESTKNATREVYLHAPAEAIKTILIRGLSLLDGRHNLTTDTGERIPGLLAEAMPDTQSDAAIFGITGSEDVLRQHELVEQGCPYRQRLLPPEVLEKGDFRIRLLSEQEVDEICDASGPLRSAEAILLQERSRKMFGEREEA